MPTYVSLYTYTQKGIESSIDGPARLEAAKQTLAAAGGELRGFYVTMGQYDSVTIAVLLAPRPSRASMAVCASAS